MSETIISPTGQIYQKVATATTTPAADTSVKPVYVQRTPKIVPFFIGGASDKRPFLGQGPFGNVRHVQDEFLKRFGHQIAAGQIADVETGAEYLGYYEVFGDEQIAKNVLPLIPSKNTAIILIGHSLGGWNSAHLSHKLSAMGYCVDLLITLDPVGEHYYTSLSRADIYSTTPKPVCNFWINLRYDGKTEDWFPNEVARVGGQWNIVGTGKSNIGNPNATRLPDLNEVVAVNHANTLRAMFTPLRNGDTAWSTMTTKINERLLTSN